MAQSIMTLLQKMYQSTEPSERIPRETTYEIPILRELRECNWRRNHRNLRRSSDTAQPNSSVPLCRRHSGAVVPDAAVVLHSKPTNLNRMVPTNSVGVYVIPDV